MTLINCDDNISFEVSESKTSTGLFESLNCNILRKNIQIDKHSNLGKITIWDNKINIIFYSSKESRFNEITKNAMKHLLDYYFQEYIYLCFLSLAPMIINSRIKLNKNEAVNDFINFYTELGFEFHEINLEENKIHSFCEQEKFYAKFPELLNPRIEDYSDVEKNKIYSSDSHIPNTKRSKSSDESSCEIISASESLPPSNIFSISSYSSVFFKSPHPSASLKTLTPITKSSSERDLQKIHKPTKNLILALNGYSKSLSDFSELKI